MLPPPAKGSKAKRFMVTLPAEDYAALEELARRRGEPIATTARLAIQAAVRAETRAAEEVKPKRR